MADRTALDFISGLYEDAISRCGVDWERVEADVQKQLLALAPRERRELMRELTLAIAATSNGPYDTKPH